MQCACQQQEQQKGCCCKQKTSSGQSFYPVGQHDVHVNTQLGTFQSVCLQILLKKMTKATHKHLLASKAGVDCCPWHCNLPGKGISHTGNWYHYSCFRHKHFLIG